jgi:hypothetical protein
MQRVPERKFDGMIAVFATAEDNNTFSPAQTFRRRSKPNPAALNGCAEM